MNMSEHIRLSLLEEELRPTMRTVEESDDRFDFTRTKGPNPKLWIDMTSYVTMGKDQRTYRFQKDSNMGLIVLAETSDVKKTASIISEYVAEQVSERDKMMKEEWSSFNETEGESEDGESDTVVSLSDYETPEETPQGDYQLDEEVLEKPVILEEPEEQPEQEEPEPNAEEQSQSEVQPKKRSALAGLIWFLFGLLVFVFIIAAALFLGAPDAY